MRDIVDYQSVFRRIYSGGAYGTNTTHKFIHNSQKYTVVLNRYITYEGTIEYSILQQIPTMYTVAPCIRGEIQKDVLYISTVEKYGTCVLPELSSYQGITLLKFFVRQIKSYHPEVIKSELTDHAKILCDGIKVTLSDMMMLTRGRTYYELAGYRACKPRDQERYEHNMSILSRLVWKKALKNLKKAMIHAGIDVKDIEFPVVEIEHRDAMRFMFKKYCKQMAEAMGYYMDLIGLNSMYGVEYCLGL